MWAERPEPVAAKQALFKQQHGTNTPDLLPCPCCGSTVIVNEIPPHKHTLATFMPDYEGGCFIECPSCNYANCGKTKQEALANHNRRPAPPIGRCKDCKHQGTGDSDICHSGLSEEFCSGFEPK